MEPARFPRLIPPVVTAIIVVVAGLAWPRGTAAQAPDAPVIDSIVVETRNVFEDDEASNFLFRLTNALHFKTHPYVVRRELLFQVGERYDSAVVAETERNLRALGVFREVTIDTVRRAGRLVVTVTTSDGWSTDLNLTARSTGGVFTWSAGLTERNLLGTANLAGVSYRDEVDRNALRVLGRINRAFGSRLVSEGFYDDLSDGQFGAWAIGVPFRALGDRESITLSGEAADRRTLRYRTEGDIQDTAFWWRRALVQRASVAYAPVAGSNGYVRVGLEGQVRREEFIPVADTGLAIEDTVTAALGLFGEAFRPRFVVVTHYNGFAREEDVDLSTRVRLAAWMTPSGLGYAQTGVVPTAALQVGGAVGKVFARLQAEAHGLFTADGLDSGRVWVGLTAASRLLPRQATVLRVEAGAQERPVPGAEFDLGHGLGPRAFAPHAFTGTRSVWGILEHRTFLVDDLLGLLGVGIAAFLDYGGAWYPDQDARFGGDVGLGLRLGTTRSTGANVGRFDLAYQFGDGVDGSRWVFSFGRAFEF